MKLKQSAWTVGLVAAGSILGAGAVLTYNQTAHAAAPEAQVEKDVGGGAPTKVVNENDNIRVTLVSYPSGFRRQGGFRRRADQVIVYIDDGDFKVEPRPGAKPNPTPNPNAGAGGPESSYTLDGVVAKNGFHPKGTTAWHPKDSLTPTIVTKRAYRALYIEMKK